MRSHGHEVGLPAGLSGRGRELRRPVTRGHGDALVCAALPALGDGPDFAVSLLSVYAHVAGAETTT